jgi:hypothetical protein
MKTPMQELIEQLKEERDGFLKLPPHSNIQERTENCFGSCIEIAERMLEKEKEVIVNAVKQGWDYNEEGLVQWMGETYYNETFNTTDK